MSPKPMVVLLTAVAALVALVVVPSLAPAQKKRTPKKVNIAVGIGDQTPAMFDHPAFLRLKVKKARYFISWNAIDNPEKLRIADEWLAGAKRRRVRPLFHLDGVFTNHAPTVREYRQKVGALVRRYRAMGVREWGVWNEANSRTQPVFRLATRTAKYFLELRKMCRRCTIVALDLLDAGNLRAYIRSFYRALRKKKRLASVVGIHNYGDTNRARRNNTKTIIKTVRRYNKRAKFWMTETGGLAYFATAERVVFPCNERRQARAVGKMFKLARKYRRHVTRLYPFSFFGTDCATHLRFDAGLVRQNGSTRPAFTTMRRAMRGFRR